MTRSKPKPKLRTMELVKSTYQPTKAELKQANELIPASFEEVAKAMVQPVNIRYIDKPRDRRG